MNDWIQSLTPTDLPPTLGGAEYVVLALTMMLLARNILIALGLLSVFAMIRFRNVLKDTRDTTFILWAVVEGVACGTLRFGIAVTAAFTLSLIFVYLRLTSFGGRHRYD